MSEVQFNITIVSNGEDEMIAACERIADRFAEMGRPVTISASIDPIVGSFAGPVAVTPVEPDASAVSTAGRALRLEPGKTPSILDCDKVPEEHVPTPAAQLFAPTPPVPAPNPPLAVADCEVDSAGTPWDAAIHAGQPGKEKPKKMDGTWKARRGSAKKMPTNANSGVAWAEVDTALAKLINAGVDADEINVPVSQAVFCDLSKTTGGMEHVRATNDPAVNLKALSSLQAIAAQRGVTL